jgi:hypothetical protein
MRGIERPPCALDQIRGERVIANGLKGINSLIQAAKVKAKLPETHC